MKTFQTPKMTIFWRRIIEMSWVKIFFRNFGAVTFVQNFFKQIRAINRTNSRPIWAPTYEDIDHIAKNGWKDPLKNPTLSFLWKKIKVIACLEQFLANFSLKLLVKMKKIDFELEKN